MLILIPTSTPPKASLVSKQESRIVRKRWQPVDLYNRSLMVDLHLLRTPASYNGISVEYTMRMGDDKGRGHYRYLPFP